MSESNEKDGEGSQNDEFEFYIQFTKPLVLDLRSSEDKAIASAWVQKLEVPPQTEEEKKLRLDYLKLLLFVLQRGRLSGIFKKQPAPGGLQPFPQGFSMADMGNLIIDRDEIQSSGGGDNQSIPYTIELSSDLREFVAAQEIPNFGVQMYYAWSSDEAIHKWSLFDEDKFSSYILDKIKQLKDAKSDDKTSSRTCSKKPCDVSFTKNFSKSKVKTPEEIEKSQGRSYQTYLGLVGRMGGGFKDCDDDQDKYPKQDQPRKTGSSKKCPSAPRRCPVEIDEEYENFLSGLSGHNSTQKRNCKCPYPHHRPDCDAYGKGVQPCEERNPRSMSPKSKPETGACNVWPGQGAGGSKQTDQCEYGSQFSPVIPSQRNMSSCRGISPIRNEISSVRNDMSPTGPAFKDSNRVGTCSASSSPCTCPCPRQPAQQNSQMEVLRASTGPSPPVMQQGSCGRPGGNRPRLQRPVNLMSGSDPCARAGGVGEASAPSQPQLHCFNQQFQTPCPKAQTTLKFGPNEECDNKPMGEDRRKQKIANLSKIIAKEAREEDEIDDMYSCYKGSQVSPSNRPNFDCTQTLSPQLAPQTFPRLRLSFNVGKVRQQQPQADDNCFDFGAPPAQSNQCYSGGFQQPGLNNMTFTTSPECKRRTKSSNETLIKSVPYSQNQPQYDERAPCQYMQPGMGGSEAGGVCPPAHQTDPCNPCSNFKGQNRPKSQSDSCPPGGFPSANSSSGRANDLASVLQGIHSKTEAHREKCSRRAQSGEPSSFQRTSPSRSASPFPNQPSSQLSCQPPASQNKSQSQCLGKSRPDATAEGMMPGQCPESSQNVPIAWAPPSTYCPPQGMRQPMNYDPCDNYRKEGASSPGKGVCSPMANQQSQSPGAYRSPRNNQDPCQGPSPPSACQRPPQPSACQRPPPPSACQEPPPPSACQGQPPSNYQGPPISNYQRTPPQGFQPSNYQGPSPSACQGFQPQSFQGPPSSNFQDLQAGACQPEDEDPCDEEDEVSCPESLDECPPGSSTSAEFMENAPCDDSLPSPVPPQQWPTPAGQCRRSPDPRGKECGQNNQGKRRIMITSTPKQAPFLAEESTIPCPTPNMNYQYEQMYGGYSAGQCQEISQGAQFYPIFGNSENPCAPSPQNCNEFMEMQNDQANTSSSRRRNMLAAPMPDDQFSLSPTQSPFGSCSKPGY